MAVSVKELLIKLKADTSGVTAGLDGVKKKMKDTSDSSVKSIDKIKSSFEGLKAALVGGAILGGAAAITKMADRFNQLQGKVKGVIPDVSQFNSVMSTIIDSANRSGVSMDAAATSFLRISNAVLRMGYSTDEVVRFNETFSKMGALAGASGVEVEGALYQISQGLASGKLQGDELKTVLEAMPSVADAISEAYAKKFGGSIESVRMNLKQLAADGAITPRIVMDAIIAKSRDVDSAFKALPPSVDRSMAQLGNSLTLLVGKLNEVLKITDTVSGMFQVFKAFIDGVADSIGGLVTELQSLNSDMQPIKTTADELKNKADDARKAWVLFLNNIRIAAAQTAGYFVHAFLDMANKVKLIFFGLAGSIVSTFEAIINSVTQLGGLKVNLGGGFLTKQFGDARKEAQKLQQMQLKIANTGLLQQTKLKKFNVGVRTSYGMGGDDEDGKKGKKKKGAKAKKSDAEKEMDRLKDQAKSLSEAVLMPWEKEAKAIAEADKLLKLHLITQETYKRAVADANKDALAGIDVSAAMEDWKRLFSTEQMRQGLGTTDFAVKFSDESTKALSDYMQVLEDIKTPQDEFNEKIARLNELQAQFGLTQQQVTEATKVYTEELQDALKGDTEDALKSLENAVQGFGKKFEDTFIQAAMTGKFQFKSLAASILEDIARILLHVSVIDPIVNAITGAGGGNKSGRILESLASSLFGSFGKIGKKATGGDTLTNRPYIVGEKGPELFMPGKAGRVMPNGQTMSALNGGGSSGTTIVQNLNFSLGVQETVRREIQGMMPQIASQTVSAVNGDIRYGGKTSRSVGRRA